MVQELEGLFRGAGWNVIKVLWGSDFDELFANDTEGILAKRASEVVDGDYQKYSVAGGAYIREHFYGVDPRLLAMVAGRSDDELWRMRLGGHDPTKVYAAYHAAVRHKGAPTVVLARTIKGYGLGEAGEGRNITHTAKETQRGRTPHVPRPVPYPSVGRRGHKRAAVSANAGEHGGSIRRRAGCVRWAGICRHVPRRTHR